MSGAEPNALSLAGAAGAVLRSTRALILDWDGTLAAGSRPLPGVAAFLTMLSRRGIAFTVATNNSTALPAHYCEILTRAGAPVTEDQIVTSAEAAAAYLAGELPRGARVYVVGEAGLRIALTGAGFTVVGDGDAATVVVGGDRAISHDKLKRAIRLIRGGARFIGTNPDLLVPAEDGLAPEAGVLLAAITAGAGVAPTVIGKPERPLLELAMARMEAAPQTTAILGDRLDTDIAGGRRLGLTTILVTTGVDAAARDGANVPQPALVVGNLDELTRLWESVT